MIDLAEWSEYFFYLVLSHTQALVFNSHLNQLLDSVGYYFAIKSDLYLDLALLLVFSCVLKDVEKYLLEPSLVKFHFRDPVKLLCIVLNSK